MQAAEIADQLVPGPQVEMVRIGENDLRAGFDQVVAGEHLHGCLRADRHEGGRLDRAVRQDEPSGARGAAFPDDLELEHQSTAIASPYE